MSHYLELIDVLLAAYGSVAVFFFGVLEEIFFFIPTPFFFVGIGFLIIDNQLSLVSAFSTALFKIALPAAAGVVIGGLVIYWIIYFGGRPLVKKIKKYLGFGLDELDNLNQKFKKGHIDEVALVLLRAVPLVPIGIISVFCGLIRLNIAEFIWTTFVGTTLRFVGLSLFGWYLGKEYLKYAEQIVIIERYAAWIFAIVMLIGLAYLYAKRRESIEEQG